MENKCENCISQNVCRWWQNGDGKHNLNCTDEVVCPEYKDKSLCVELPCKVGDTIWGITEKNGKKIVEKSVVEEFHIFTSENKMIIELDTTWLRLESIGEIAFLTKEETEQKLKEMENGK